MKKEIMSPERLASSLAIPDLTDTKNGIHSINIVVQNVKRALEKEYAGIPIEEIHADPRVSIEANFDDLLFPSDNAGRSSRYTRYVDEGTVLRTHTSAAIPGWLKDVAEKKTAEDTIVVIPGMCYRRDVVDKTHCGEPHQMDVWRVKRGEPRLERPDLIRWIETILDGTAPGYEYRANEMKHPYTINGLEVEIMVDGKWLELLECGEIHPVVLENAGLDPQAYSGLALGMGLDRLVMIVKKIDDIRILRSNDSRIKKQMTHLETFVSVSDQPPATRVLSYSTSTDKTEEDVCEEIRDELKENASLIEEIAYEEVPYEKLPDKAKENLGIHPDQKNVVVTLTFRSPEGSLQRELVNQWVERLYPQLNKGDKGYYV